MLEFFSEFGAALPDAARALYQFGDPASLGRGWVGALIMILWFGPLLALPLWVAKRTYGTHEWVSATMGVMAASSAIWWIFGVLPHGWIQFMEANENILAGTLFPETAGFTVGEDYRIDVATNLYGVIADSVVGLLTVAGVVLGILLFLRVQKSLPKTMATGETKPEAGGYK